MLRKNFFAKDNVTSYKSDAFINYVLNYHYYTFGKINYKKQELISELFSRTIKYHQLPYGDKKIFEGNKFFQCIKGYFRKLNKEFNKKQYLFFLERYIELIINYLKPTILVTKIYNLALSVRYQKENNLN